MTKGYSILEKLSIILLAFFIAIPLPIALPPIVNAAINAVIISIGIILSVFSFNTNIADIVAPQEPDIIPHISPITSLQKLETLSLFLINLMFLLILFS